ncbi:serine/threonine-protein kinase MARK2-like isoform X6 [Aphis craccivora]|uniref:Serine/threonine-protein kinase MARK2-like isoform X6 n=1 Tax=Aphis craccivora TaxID=307492 RepID=A0A6G0ZNW8_APHCR|nr:serine/threonine-protein kinase MARK2-like isoform X6 [Aphis craccivora]
MRTTLQTVPESLATDHVTNSKGSKHTTRSVLRARCVLVAASVTHFFLPGGDTDNTRYAIAAELVSMIATAPTSMTTITTISLSPTGARSPPSQQPRPVDNECEYRTAAAGPVCVMVVFSVFSVSASSEIGTGRRLALSHRSIHSCHTNNNNNNISININKIARRGLVSDGFNDVSLTSVGYPSVAVNRWRPPPPPKSLCSISSNSNRSNCSADTVVIPNINYDYGSSNIIKTNGTTIAITTTTATIVTTSTNANSGGGGGGNTSTARSYTAVSAAAAAVAAAAAAAGKKPAATNHYHPNNRYSMVESSTCSPSAANRAKDLEQHRRFRPHSQARRLRKTRQVRINFFPCLQKTTFLPAGRAILFWPFARSTWPTAAPPPYS